MDSSRPSERPWTERPFPGDRPLRIGALLSGKGRGTNLQALIDSCAEGRISGEIAVVISTTPGAPALERAHRHGIPSRTFPGKSYADGEALDDAILACLNDHRVDLICLAGYMRKAGQRLCEAYRWRMMNIHPGLIPAFCGQGLYGGKVHAAVLEYGAKVSGVTVHFATEEYDAGPIILQKCVPVAEDDTPETLAARILPVEHAAYSEAVQLFAEGRLEVLDGRRVRILPKRG
ncbi:MAG: phosphoribosylglycinamide formyltransferase [Armatimonadetes bacterium]|nr:phosphoribosylglycinamide formyltransferase [Armatimonadota bacterium]